jgi:hypothetical protein
MSSVSREGVWDKLARITLAPVVRYENDTDQIQSYLDVVFMNGQTDACASKKLHYCYFAFHHFSSRCLHAPAAHSHAQ